MEAPPINEDEMEQLLEWIDGLSFSRPKRNLARDFSDGVLVAEILRQYHPRLVQLHNYPSASALNAKFNNWKTLNGTPLLMQTRSSASCASHFTRRIYKTSSRLSLEPSNACSSSSTRTSSAMSARGYPLARRKWNQGGVRLSAIRAVSN